MLAKTRTTYFTDQYIAHALGVVPEDFDALCRELNRTRRESRMAELLADAERQLQRQREAHRRQKKARTSEDFEAAIADQITAQVRLERAQFAMNMEQARKAAGFTALETEREQAEAERQGQQARDLEFLRECRKVARQTLVYGVPYLLALGLFFAGLRILGLI